MLNWNRLPYTVKSSHAHLGIKVSACFLQGWSRVSHILCYEFFVTPPPWGRKANFEYGGLWKEQFQSSPISSRKARKKILCAKLLTSTVLQWCILESSCVFFFRAYREYFNNLQGSFTPRNLELSAWWRSIFMSTSINSDTGKVSISEYLSGR